MDFSQRSIYRRKATADSFLAPSRPTRPSLSWCSPGKRDAHQLRLSLSYSETSPLGWFLTNRAVSGSSLCLRRLLKSQTEAAAWTWESSFDRNQSWDVNLDLFGIKIARDLVRAFLKHPTLSVLPPNSKLQPATETKPMAVLLIILMIFLFNSFGERIWLVLWHILVTHCLSRIFFPPNFFSPGEHVHKNLCLCQRSNQTRYGFLSKIDRLCRLNGLSDSVALWSCLLRIAISLVFGFTGSL